MAQALLKAYNHLWISTEIQTWSLWRQLKANFWTMSTSSVQTEQLLVGIRPVTILLFLRALSAEGIVKSSISRLTLTITIPEIQTRSIP